MHTQVWSCTLSCFLV